MNENMIRVITLLEESGKEALDRAAKEAFGEVAEPGAKSVLDGYTSSNVYNSNVTFVSKFIQAFLQIFSGAEEKPRKIETVVSTIIKELFLTGLEQLKVANKMVTFSKESVQYRIKRFQNALNNFDRARSLASEDFDIALIDLLRGLCAFELPGGTSEALVHLMAFQLWAHKEVEHLASIREERQKKAELLSVEIESLKYSLNLKQGDGPLILALQHFQNRAQYLEVEINGITLLEAKILDIIFYITALLEVAKKK